jgi:hypothetical protein
MKAADLHLAPVDCLVSMATFLKLLNFRTAKFIMLDGRLKGGFEEALRALLKDGTNRNRSAKEHVRAICALAGDNPYVVLSVGNIFRQRDFDYLVTLDRRAARASEKKFSSRRVCAGSGPFAA